MGKIRKHLGFLGINKIIRLRPKKVVPMAKPKLRHKQLYKLKKKKDNKCGSLVCKMAN